MLSIEKADKQKAEHICKTCKGQMCISIESSIALDEVDANAFNVS